MPVQCRTIASVFRLSVLFSALTITAAAQAHIRYTFKSAFGEFTVTTNLPIAKKLTLPAYCFSNAKGFLDAKISKVYFLPNTYGSDSITIYQGKDRYSFEFRPGKLQQYGNHKTYVGIQGTLTVEKVTLPR